ncbi:unnamed protein product [Bursaphelenchus okinawaensis]|uniref:Uncharacterized protein n=1 Tax=Bursaphelenchus okinawaensis TaxID=465554 RepID=A0A811LRJ3_9BILA|nr:unnamed protein product [Bursaphelenchus okinawaensis]CAG9127670.1 unnamed protein product [Bursaphelenchus okinawaensis]
MEGYFLPRSPTKRVQDIENIKVPGSPDMKHARSRLDHLLTGIRTGESQQTVREESVAPRESEFVDETKKGPGRPRRPRQDNGMVFELRGKSFMMEDNDTEDTVYEMCRRWIYGKHDDSVKIENDPPVEPFHEVTSLDLMATKPIYFMPGPDEEAVELPPVPENLPVNVQSHEVPDDEHGLAMVMADHIKHWKNVRRCFNEHNEARKARHRRSVDLLRTVYNIAQQTQT